MALQPLLVAAGDVDGYLTGACLAIRREAWDALGPFDEEFFLYGEEADWQRRAIAAGWRIRLADERGVRHSAQGTVAGDAKASTRSSDLVHASVALQLEYHHGAAAADLYAAGAYGIDGLKRALHRDDSRRPQSDAVLVVDGPQSPSADEIVSRNGIGRRGSRRDGGVAARSRKPPARIAAGGPVAPAVLVVAANVAG